MTQPTRHNRSGRLPRGLRLGAPNIGAVATAVADQLSQGANCLSTDVGTFVGKISGQPGSGTALRLA